MTDDIRNHLSRVTGTATARARSEPELRQRIVQCLQASGIAVAEQVACGAGAADIVTLRQDAVIEVKLDLTRKQIQWAVGQVLLYRQAINPNARAIVVGYATEETSSLVAWAAAVGVEVVVWKADDGRLKSELITGSDPSAFSNPPFTLLWNVQSLAYAHGITRVADLARFLGLPRQGLYGAWRGTAASVSVQRLERFALRLSLEPHQPLAVGDWFRWDRNGHLIWAVKLVAEQVGLDAAQLAFRADQYPQQMALFYEGDAQFVFIDTLARLAIALETTERPFDIGEVFVRAEVSERRAEDKER